MKIFKSYEIFESLIVLIVTRKRGDGRYYFAL
jgi:hypothetical protein